MVQDVNFDHSDSEEDSFDVTDYLDDEINLLANDSDEK